MRLRRPAVRSDRGPLREPDSPCLTTTQAEAARYFPVGPPYILHVNDWRRLAPVWRAFAPRVYPFSSATPFKDLPRLEADALAARRLEDPEAEEWIGRSYVLVSCPDGLAAEEALARYRDPLVLFSGRLGDELEGTGLFGLDLESVDEARRVLELAGPGLEWSYHPWWGTECLEEFLLQ